MVDAADSKSAVRKNVLVRFQSRAPHPFLEGVFSNSLALNRGISKFIYSIDSSLSRISLEVKVRTKLAICGRIS